MLYNVIRIVFLNGGNHCTFSISQRVFHSLLLKFKEFVHETSHLKPHLICINFWYQNLHYVWKNGGGVICRSEQAPSTFNINTYRHMIRNSNSKALWVKSIIILPVFTTDDNGRHHFQAWLRVSCLWSCLW